MTLPAKQQEVDVSNRRRSNADGLLNTLLPCDHLIVLAISAGRKKCERSLWPSSICPALAKGLTGRADIVETVWLPSSSSPSEEGKPVKNNTRLLLGLRRSEEDDDEGGSSVILGPLAGPDSTEAGDFRQFWGKELCQLRRFEDGSIRESVDVHNPWGPSYSSAAIVAHLLRVHFADVASVAELVRIDGEEILPTAFQTRDHVRRVRNALSELSAVLTKLSDPSLPLRRVRGLGPALHCEGDLLSGALCPNKTASSAGDSKSSKRSKKDVVTRKGNCLLLRLDGGGGGVATSLVRPIPVMLDVTHKKGMESKMFTYLATAYLLNLKKGLEAKGMACAMKDLKLLVRFKSFLFSLEIESSSTTTAAAAATGGSVSSAAKVEADSFLQGIGLRFSSWAGACHVVKEWLEAKMMSHSVPPLTTYLLLASVFSTQQQKHHPPRSVESAVLRFLDLLSFHDFVSEAVVVAPQDVPAELIASVSRSMREARPTLPDLVLVTPFDGVPSSPFSRGICAADSKRLVNLARQTLHSLLVGEGGVPRWSVLAAQTMACDLRIYDVVIHLKPLLIPKVKAKTSSQLDQLNKEATETFSFPVVDFDPVALYLQELRECFGDVARFYYGKYQPVIGVKLESEAIDQVPKDAPPLSANSGPSAKRLKGRFLVRNQLVPNVEAMVADFRVMGQGIVKEVNCNIKV